jgi:hypothetical protein
MMTKIIRGRKFRNADWFLSLESLTVRRIIQFTQYQWAIKALFPQFTPPPTSPKNERWASRFNNLIVAVRNGGLKSTKSGGHPADAEILPADLWQFCKERAGDWEWCRDFCRRWSEVSGIPLAGSNASSIVAQNKCTIWLAGLMRSGAPTKSKELYWDEAQKKFSGLSERSFLVSWKTALAETGASGWSRPGRRKQS